jgi:phosphatidylserine synthase
METIAEIRELCKESKPDTRLKRKVSYYITWILLGLKFTANQVSALGVVLGLMSCIFFIFGNRVLFIVGAILLLLGQLMDYCDGEVARYRKRKGMKDEFLRNYGGGFDCLNHVAPPFALICMSFGLMYDTNYPVLILIIGFLSATFQFIRAGLTATLTFVLKFANIKFKNIRFKKGILDSFHSLFKLSIALVFTSIFDIITDSNLTVYVFIIYAVLGLIAASKKIYVQVKG